VARKLSKQHYIDAVKLLRHGFYDESRERRSGKFADGFEARDGFDLRYVDQWTTAQKAEVTKLYNQVDKLMARPFQVVRSRKPENLRRVQEAAQHITHPKKLKVAFVPVARPGEQAEVKISPPTKAYPKGRVVIRERGVTRTPVTFEDVGFDFDDLEENTAGTVRELIAQYPGKLYVPLAGEYETKGQATSPEGLAAALRKLMNLYGSEAGYDEDDTNSHHYKNWLFGVAVYNFRTLKEFKAYRVERTKKARALKLQRRRDRYAFRKAHGSRGKPKRHD
jgi:hypothetical protein